MDFAAINNITNNMPILDQTVQDPINKESEEFMSILNDLQKDCNQDFGSSQQQPPDRQQQQQPLEPASHHQQQQQQLSQQPSNAQIMDGLIREQENQEFFDNNKIDDVMDGNKIVENKLNDLRSADGGKDFPSPGPHPVILSPRFSPKSNPTQESEPQTQLAEQSNFQQFPNSMYQQQPNQSPGVIVSRPQQQEQQQQQENLQQQQQQQEEQKAVQQLLEHDPQISLPQPEPSFPFETSNNPSDQTDCKEPPIQQRIHSEAQAAVPETSKDPTLRPESQLNSDKVMQVGGGQARRDSDGHASPAVRAIVANKILHRNRSLSDSIDSRKSEAWSEAPATPPLTPVGPPDHQPGHEHHFQTSENAPDQVVPFPQYHILTPYFQLMAVNEEDRETSPSPPPPAPPTPEPVPSAAGEILDQLTLHLIKSCPHALHCCFLQMQTDQSVTTVERALEAKQQLRAT